jgi:hypothetical protein
MVNLFPDFVQHDTPPGRKASWLYMVMLTCSILAATLYALHSLRVLLLPPLYFCDILRRYYSLATSPLIKTATKIDDFFGLEMYEGTTNCGNWYVSRPKMHALFRL